MTLEAGTRLGAYEVLSPLGAGGMGEVYRARDTRLGREVAVKVLPEELSEQKDRLARFEQEARAASALNHPNIVTIHEVGFEGERPFIAMELVDGKSVGELSSGEPMPVRRLLSIGTQIAEGLAKAHSAGIVHRDLKPENVMVSKDGFVKILDFGLAKLAEPERGGVSAMPTLAKPETRPGVVMGTVSYMSPEQASGESLDYRSDQFSLGAMLYELATGKRAFQRKTSAETMSAIIREEPEPAGRLRPELPAPVRWILERCLAKDREDRYASTRDLARELAAVRDHISEITSGAEAVVEGRAAPRRQYLLAALAALALLLGGLFAGRALFRVPIPTPPSFHRLTFQKGGIANARFAPDGTTVLYGATFSGRETLYQVRIGSPESSPFEFGAADILAVSSGGEMAVKQGGELANTLARVPILGGAPRPVADDVLWAGADWSPDGRELLVARLVEGKGRLEFPIGTLLLEGRVIGCPRFSPRGDRIAFMQEGRIAVIGPDGKGKRSLTEGSPEAPCPLAWRPDGREIWFGGQTSTEHPALYAVDLAGRLRLVARVPGSLELFDISREGRVLLAQHAISRVVRGVFPASPQERDFAWLDRTIPAELSRDGEVLLFTEQGEGSPGGPSVYLRKTDGSPAVRLGDGHALALSPDGQRVLAQAGVPPHLAILPTGTGPTRQLPNDRFEDFSSGRWLPDGKGIVFTAREKGARWRVYTQPLEGGGPRPITPPGVSYPRFPPPVSPDGKAIFALDASRKGWLYPLDGGDPRPMPALGEDRVPIQWSEDGRSLYVGTWQPSGGIWKLDLKTGEQRIILGIDTGGFGRTDTVITPDGRYYAIGYDDVSSALYVVDGLR
jgi:hypothetical protein